MARNAYLPVFIWELDRKMPRNTIAKTFIRSESGTIAVLWGMALVVFLGLAALVYDIGRLGITQSELQSFADNVALAAAGELDGNSDSITRAEGAAAALIVDRQSFGAGSHTLSGTADYTLTFHSALPASDLTPLGAAVTTDPRAAIFAQVVATPRSVSMAFTSAVATILGTGPGGIAPLVGAEAVAGFTQEACDITPLMFCLPSASYTADANIGNLVRLRSGGQGAAWGPGDFGFLDPSQADLGSTCAGLSGVQLIACLIGAEDNITQCYQSRGVDTQPGQQVGIQDAIFNIRFDIYRAIMNGNRNDPAYPPAPNVISGIVPSGGGSCMGANPDPSPDTIGLPRDDCFAAGTCTRYGDGNWNYGSYIDRNYGNNNGVFEAGEDAALTAYEGMTDPQYAGTRYETYLREIMHGNNPTPGGDILTGRAETGRPQCSSQMSSNPERRVVIAAGVDCIANPVAGNTTDLPVEEFFEMFLTEPVGSDAGSPPTLDLWVEIIGSAGTSGYTSAGAGGIFRDIVQLYR